MYNSSLVTVLKSFSKAEIKSFGLFVESPYYNTSKATIKLYDTISSFHPNYDGKNFTKEHLFRSVYGNDKYSDALLRKLVSNLIKLTEEFLTQKEFENHKFFRKLYRLKQYTHRNLTVQFGLLSKKLEKFLENEAIIDEYYFHYQKEFSETLYEQKFYSLDKDTHRELDRMYDFTSIDFALKMITYLHRNQVSVRIRKNSSNESLVAHYKDYLDMEVLIKKIGTHFPQYMWIIELYQLSLKSHIDPENNKLYDKYREAVFKNLSRFTVHEQRNHLVNLLNLVTYRQRTGLISQTGIHQQKFDIMSLMIERGYIDFFGFQVFIRTCCHLKKFAAAEQFVNTHYSILRLDDPKQALLFGNMLIHFYKRDYQKAVSTASKLNLNNTKLLFMIKQILIIANIELGETEHASYLLDSYTIFIRSKVVSEERKERYGNFIRFTKIFLDQSIVRNTSDMQRSITALEPLNCIEKDWLLNKFKNLKKR
jgi:hypothetical protein